MFKTKLFFLSFCYLFLLSCTSTVINTTAPIPIPAKAKIAVLPFINNTETPMAGRRAMSITAVTLKTRGFCTVESYPYNEPQNMLLPGIENKPETHAKQLHWARQIGARFVMTGNVNEWSYKVGLDGEPVVGVSLQLIDLKTNRTVWSAVGSKSGGSRIALTTIAQELITSMLKRLYPANL